MSQQTKLLGPIPHAVAIDLLAVVKLTNGLNIILESHVREERSRLLRGGGAARQRARAHGDVRKELRHLERIPTLLKELLITSRSVGLLSLLLQRASANLSLRALQRGLLRTRAEPRQGLGGLSAHAIKALTDTLLKRRLLRAHAINVLADASLRLSSAKTLNVLLLTKTSKSLTLGNVLPKCRLTKVGKLLARSKVLRESLLTQIASGLHAELHGRAIRLFRRKLLRLLLLGCAKGLPVSRLKQVGESRLIGEALLSSQIGLTQTSPLTTKGTTSNLLAG